jgi:hypothetical protein
VHHHEHVELAGKCELGTVVLVLARRLVVVADLADGNHALLGQVTRQDIHHLFGERLVIGLLAVQSDGAVVTDAELRGAEALPADDARQIVDVATDAGARLPKPEGGFDDSDDAGGDHTFVVVRGAAAMWMCGSMKRIASGSGN